MSLQFKGDTLLKGDLLLTGTKVPDWSNVTRSRTIIDPNPTGTAQYDHYGWRIALEGTISITSSIHEDTGADAAGAAYIHNISTGSLLRNLVNPNPVKNGHFGISLSISGNRCIVGSKTGAAYIYDVTTGSLLHTLTGSSSYFGRAVGVSGNFAVVGDTTSGTVGVYDVTTGSLLHTLTNTGGFGNRIAISGNKIVVVATAGGGTAYMYDISSGTPTTPTGSFTNPGTATLASSGSYPGGYPLAMSDKYCAAGVPDSGNGKVYVLDTTTGSLISTIYALSGSNDDFGLGVAIIDDEGTLVIGDPNYGSGNDGRVYVYHGLSGTLQQTIINPNTTDSSSNDLFGQSVAISGTNLALSAVGEDTLSDISGVVHIYTL